MRLSGTRLALTSALQLTSLGRMEPVQRAGFVHRLLVIAFLFHCVAASGAPDYRSAIYELTLAAEAEVAAGNISGVTIALIDDQQLVFARGFGWADKKRRVPATADTIYRAGSISKLFAASAAMQLEEQGKLDLDQPVTNYVPEFSIIVPFENAQPITLRQLMCHRSGLVREAPVGSYFDGSEPGMKKTVASLARCVLVHPPGSKTKYSNSGVTLVGRAVEEASQLSFPEYTERHLLVPMGMTNSAFLRNKPMQRKLAIGYLPVALPGGGFREIDAPVFEFGILAAGNLYTTAGDLGRFMSCLFARGRAGERQVIAPQTLDRMFTPQFTTDTNGFGLGFSMGTFRRKQTFGHMGAVYGFTSSFMGIRSEKIGAVVLCNDDIVVGPVRKLNALALGLMLAAKTGADQPAPAKPAGLSDSELRAFTGDYESQSWWATIDVVDGKLLANISGQTIALTPVGPLRCIGEGRVAFDAPFQFAPGKGGVIAGFAALNQNFRRVDPARVPPVPEAWKPLLGSYGPSFIPLIVSVKHGRLYAMTENEFDNRLTPVTATVFQMPPGMYVDEQLVFQTGRNGRPHTAVLANMPLRRR
jgi:CubicO group peptidase (beta-lactamase class C family)